VDLLGNQRDLPANQLDLPSVLPSVLPRRRVPHLRHVRRRLPHARPRMKDMRRSS
jgi:hypothetical protein